MHRRGAGMTLRAMTVQVRVPDVPAARRWYTSLLGRAPDYDVDPAFLVEWQIAPGAWLQLVRKSDHFPPQGRIRFKVDDLEAARSRFADRFDAPLPALKTYADLVAFCDFADPWGNPLGFVKDLTEDRGRHDP